MKSTDAPGKQTVPFGSNGPREAITATTPAGSNQASYDQGFPPITMTLKSAGGLPPKGQDMNQILFELSSIGRYLSSGGGYVYDSSFSTSIGGYPMGAIIPNSTRNGFWVNTTEDNQINPENTTAALTGWVPMSSYGSTTFSGLSSSSITASSLQASKPRIILTGTLTTNINLVLPAWVMQWTITNDCAGSFGVTVKTPSGSGVYMPNGTRMIVQGNGTDIVAFNSPGSLIGVRVFNTGAQYTPTAGMKFILAHLIGGGGASGGTPATSSAQTGGSAAGNSGGYLYVRAYASDIGTGKFVSVGTGGTSQVNAAGFAGGTTSIADIATVTGGYGSGPGAVSSSTAVAQPSYSQPSINVYNKTEILVSASGSQAWNFLQTATGAGTGWASVPSPFPGGEKGRGASGIFVNASSAARAGNTGNDGAVIIMEYA